MKPAGADCGIAVSDVRCHIGDGFAAFAFHRAGHPPMHPLFSQAHLLSAEVISAAIEVQRHFGPGLLESVYVKCLERELNLRGHQTAREVPVTIRYKGLEFDERLRVDLLVDGCLVVEAKAVDADKDDTARFRAQTLSYLKLLDIPLGLVINFHNPRLGDRGVARVILKGADAP